MWRHRTRVPVAAALLLLAWIQLRLFRWKPSVEHLASSSPVCRSVDSARVAATVRAMESASRRLPFESTCLIKALAVRRMLGRDGAATSLRLGVAKGVRGEFEAHAWLELDGRVIVGGQGVERFVVLR